MRHWMIALLCVVLGAAGGGAWLWLKVEYRNEPAIAVATRFIVLLHDDHLREAYELTLKSDGLAGRDLPQFRQLAARQRCARGTWQVYALSPPQSRGNRLRRWLSGRQVEMPSITVRYDFAPNPCPYSIELRRNGQGQWRVFNFQSTAG